MSVQGPLSERIYGKILLFGEYTVLLEGDALAIPLQIPSLSGILKLEKNSAIDPRLKEWLHYLLNKKNPYFSELNFDWSKFENDIDRGLRFDSGIPIGYGAGSSGALTAAILKFYLPETQLRDLLTDLRRLKKILADFESFFHGSSSGFDPLVSILNTPIQISGKGDLNIPPVKAGSLHNWYIIDSGISRKTDMLVEDFKKRLAADYQFEHHMQKLKSFNQNTIPDFLNQNMDQVKNGIRLISSIQLAEMEWLIPDKIKAIWKEGLESDKFYLKLCGAGGGGFFLGYIPEQADLKILTSTFKVHSLEP